VITKVLAAAFGAIVQKHASGQPLKGMIMKKRKLLGQDLTPRKRLRLGKDLEHKSIQKKRKHLGESERDLVNKQRMNILICCPEHFNKETRVPEQLCKYLSVREGKCYGCASWKEEHNRILTGYGRSLVKYKPRRRLG